MYNIQTWRDKQGPLLAAVQMETLILNVLLFLIIAVAGFGILAIFFMIVVEKTKDIGILKSLGASSTRHRRHLPQLRPVAGRRRRGAGLAIGLLFVRHINQIADWLGRITGHDVFDPEIYYFYRIPTDRRSVHRRLDRAGRTGDRRVRQRAAGLPSGPVPTRGGPEI